ncbi:MAG: rod shape-determining protein MreD [Pseudomonadota bacterium]
MVDPVAARLWSYRLLFVALIALFAFLRLLPLDTVPGGVPGPDFMVALTFAWVLRRPAYVPAALIVALFLVADLIFSHPPGVGAALVLLSSEFLRRRQAISRELPFLAEWFMVSLLLAFMVIGEQLILAMTLVDRPLLTQSGLRAILTALSYPLIVAFSSFVFGVRKATPDEVSALGARL